MISTPARIWRARSRISRLARGLIWSLWIRSWGGKVGRALEVDSRARLRHSPSSGFTIGSGVYIGIGTIIDVPHGGQLVIRDGVKIMHYTVIAASEYVEIGHDTQIAEFSSVRDADHGTAIGSLMKNQLKSTPIIIGSDVWIARSVAVLRGSTIGEGAVVGANSLVNGVIDAYSIAVGAPARVIKERI